MADVHLPAHGRTRARSFVRIRPRIRFGSHRPDVRVYERIRGRIPGGHLPDQVDRLPIGRGRPLPARLVPAPVISAQPRPVHQRIEKIDRRHARGPVDCTQGFDATTVFIQPAGHVARQTVQLFEETVAERRRLAQLCVGKLPGREGKADRVRQGIGLFIVGDDVEVRAQSPSGMGLEQGVFIERIERQVRLLERGLKGSGDGLDPDQHGHVPVRISPLPPPAEGPHHGIRLGLRRRARAYPDRVAGAAGRGLYGTNGLFESVHVVGNDAGGTGYDVRPAPVIRPQGVDRGARIPPPERTDVLGVGTGEGVDHLVVIAHGEQVVQRKGEQPEHQELDGGEVLDLVHHDRIEAMLVKGPGPGVGEQDFHGAEQLLVKGHQGLLVHEAFDFGTDPADLAPVESFDLPAPFISAYGYQRSPVQGSRFLACDHEMFREGMGDVRKVPCEVLSEHPPEQRRQSSRQGLFGNDSESGVRTVRRLSADLVPQAVQRTDVHVREPRIRVYTFGHHLARGLVEDHAQYPGRLDAAPHGFHHPPRQHPGLARARGRQGEHHAGPWFQAPGLFPGQPGFRIGRPADGPVTPSGKDRTNPVDAHAGIAHDLTPAEPDDVSYAG